jgi:hypothetical protein
MDSFIVEVIEIAQDKVGDGIDQAEVFILVI